MVGNPPYVRAELLTEIRPHLQEHYKAYHGGADLYVYFYELGLRLLRPGGRLSYIVRNKWLKAELDRYVSLQKEQGLPSTGPLFRYLEHDRVLDENVVREIIRLAEQNARENEDWKALGLDPDAVFCLGVRPLHDVRTTVANRWDAMGWDMNKNAAYLGCWSTNIRVGNAADSVYKQLNGHLVMALPE